MPIAKAAEKKEITAWEAVILDCGRYARSIFIYKCRSMRLTSLAISLENGRTSIPVNTLLIP